MWARQASKILWRLTGMVAESIKTMNSFFTNIDLLTYQEGDARSSRIMDATWEITLFVGEMEKVLARLKERQSEIRVHFPESRELVFRSQSLSSTQPAGSPCPENNDNGQSLLEFSGNEKDRISNSERASAYSSSAFSRVFTDDPGSAKPSSFTQYEESTCTLGTDDGDERPKTFYKYNAPSTLR